MPARRFLVARNPELDSKLPFLLRLPLSTGDLVLKARDRWPRTARVFCHRAEGWPPDVEILEDVPVRVCFRRGIAIDLVLDRNRENRSQFVFTHLRSDREAIFWQSKKTVTSARPGIRMPAGRASGHLDLRVLVDTREQYPYRFAGQKGTTQRATLRVGDYGVMLGEELVAAVERKSLTNLAGSLVDGSLQFVLADLATLPNAAIVVEDRYSGIFKLEHVQPSFVADLLARIQVRYGSVPIVFCETRPLAEEWTFRFLGAALALAAANAAPGQLLAHEHPLDGK